MAQRAATRKPFSTEEEEALRRGVQRHGHNWATILGSGSFQPQRTNVDLKDKWRNMRKAGAEAKENVGADLQVVPVRPDRKRAREDPAPRPARSMRSGAASGQRDPTECATPVAPYLRDIDRHYLATEGLRRPCPSYLLAQPDLNARMRAILVDWLVEVHFKFKLRPETLYLTVHLIDCYLEKEAVTRQRLQLVGCTAMFIAAKYEEVAPPECLDFVYVCDKAYTRDELMKCEGQILSRLNFHLTQASPYVFLRRFAELAAVPPLSPTELLANYLLDLTLQESHMLKYLPSTVATAALYLAMQIHRRPPPDAWRRHLAASPGSALRAMGQAGLRACVRDIHELHRADQPPPPQAEDGAEAPARLVAVRKKYSVEEWGRAADTAPLATSALMRGLKPELLAPPPPPPPPPPPLPRAAELLRTAVAATKSAARTPLVVD
eukprot:Transcript_14248.p1 GENE.Transcript_14248~~Transcript_14248.p1  ORF type:complete len:493 (+),score=142.56 Transcript_14248:171-1481(+)